MGRPARPLHLSGALGIAPANCSSVGLVPNGRDCQLGCGCRRASSILMTAYRASSSSGGRTRVDPLRKSGSRESWPSTRAELYRPSGYRCATQLVELDAVAFVVKTLANCGALSGPKECASRLNALRKRPPSTAVRICRRNGCNDFAECPTIHAFIKRRHPSLAVWRPLQQVVRQR